MLRMWGTRVSMTQIALEKLEVIPTYTAISTLPHASARMDTGSGRMPISALIVSDIKISVAETHNSTDNHLRKEHC